MYRLSFIALLLLISSKVFSQSPHGDALKIDCAQCHNPKGWTIDFKTISFEHNNTNFQLEGTHTQVDCKQCHTSLTFNGTPTDCISCHIDIHNMSVGNDCVRCHSSETWLVDNIPELHEENGFPLVGAHNGLSCNECHLSDTNLRIERIGNECVSCHKEDYDATQNPNHESSGFSTNCTDCHNPFGFDWDSDEISHDFFSLTLGHDIQNCSECHTTNKFSDASPECLSCHQNEYDNTSIPNHISAQFSTDCASCHSTNPNWTPATFDHDEQFFPIYSGSHNGEWSDCIECHTNPASYAEFSCVACHVNPENNTNHEGVSGYIYENNACLSCHPTGIAGEATDHNATSFPLTGAHVAVDCLECHATGYAGTSTICNDCHNSNFIATANPKHNSIGISTDCVTCHTTDPGWIPASFAIHNNYYPLNGAHATIATDCATCHNGDYNNTPNTCAGCHQTDYNGTTNPNHTTAQFPTNCLECHTESTWTPSTLDHNTFYPLNGAHATIATNCATCHNGDYNNTPNTCVGCHQTDYNGTINPEHSTAQFPTDCLECHTESAWTPSTFDHDAQYFRINSGTHSGQWSDCATCHTNPTNYSEFSCFECHTNSQTNNDHSEVSGYTYNSNACLQCHPG